MSNTEAFFFVLIFLVVILIGGLTLREVANSGPVVQQVTSAIVARGGIQ